jgi:hypothetical protein
MEDGYPGAKIISFVTNVKIEFILFVYEDEQ